MKHFKKIMVGVLALIILLTGIFFAGRYGWRLFGFRACQGAGIESVSVRADAVEICGFYPGISPKGFCGYYAKEQDGTLYAGFRFSTVFGFFETGRFHVTIPVEGNITRVVLKTKTQETELWTADAAATTATQ